MKKQVLLFIIFCFSLSTTVWAQPTTPATTPPTRNAGDVISLFSNAYSNISGIDWNPNWGQSTVVTDILVLGNTTKRYANLNYQGVQFSTPVNASSMGNLHIDVWTSNCRAFDLFLINTSPVLFEKKVTLNPTFSGWNSFDIPLSQFTGVALSNISQMKFVGTPSATTVFVDNMYFWKSSNIPTITGFSIPEKFIGDAPFTITAPTSNSTGAFTYTSSNPTVATISGNTVTIRATGTSTITANQAAAAPYAAGSVTTTLLVSYPPPATAAPTPPVRNTGDVVALFSDAYTNIGGINWNPFWGQSTILSDVSIATNPTKKYTNFNYQGIQLGTALNVSSMSKLHMDIWTPNCTAFDFYLINTSPTTVEQKITLTPTLSGWNSYDINLSLFSLVNLANVSQIKMVATPSGSSVIYLDNLYFWKSASTPTLSNFNVPAKLVGDAPFALTAPTSNSTGSFTYTSSNPAVATVSGNLVTIIGAGTSTITANQAAAGSFGAGSISSPLVVSFPPPTTAAPTPPSRLSADYISLFSDAYLNISGTDFNPNWGQSTVVSDVTIAGNATKKYLNLNYQGIQMSNPINVSAMQFLHIDVWTPNMTAFDLFLINTTPSTLEQKVRLTPTLSGWNSFNIPMTQFTSIALNNVGQIKFEGLPAGTGTFHMDNLYFWKASNAPTLSNFNIAPKFFGDAPFTLTAPTSNSNGSFTYSSSNTAVATVSGNTVTIVGIGSSIITATQAASGSFGSGSIAATLSVTTAPPPTAAPNPPVRGTTDVISLFSDAYNNVDGTIWFPNWGQTTVVSDIVVGGNNTKKYESMNYQGVELSRTIDIRNMTKLHLDVFTKNCNTLEFYLVNISPVTIEEKVVLRPNFNGWNSFDIDLTQFDTVNKAAIAQIKMVSIPFGSSSLFLDNIYFWKPAGTVPVTLLQFNATRNNQSVRLDWKTGLEVNSQGFYIERSLDGQRWNTLQFISSKGNTSSGYSYDFTDTKPFMGLNFYRLKQVDLDGKFSYSSIVSIRMNSTKELLASVYPNPAKDQIYIQMQNSQVIPDRIELVSSAGQVIRTLNKSVSGANGLIALSSSKLTPGVYVLRIFHGNSIQQERIIINP
jgi:uncharacterized protein YjdB